MAGKRPHIPRATGRPTGPSVSASERGMVTAKLLPNKKARLTKTPGRVYLSAGFGPGGAGYPKGHKPIKEYPHAKERGLAPVGGVNARESGGATLASYKASGSESDAARRRRRVRELREGVRKTRENTESENPSSSGSRLA